MVFNSFRFLIFFPVVVSIYLGIPKKIRYIWLLLSSYYFYMSWNPKYALLIAFSTIITYTSGLLVERFRENNKIKVCKLCVAGSLFCNLAILALFKYANFVIRNISILYKVFWGGTIERGIDMLLPVGISFYTFQALSYTIDVYRGEIKAERNILRYALFVSFFPQLVAGPIERSQNLLTQIQHIEQIVVFDFNRIRDGFFLMMWGLFQKIVIADRISILVDHVINDYRNYGLIEISITVFMFAVQIYCDFGGYSNIARGAAKVMGFSLINNFQQPYLATNIKDFWSRWHISLTSWFTDYLYVPLGGNRKGLLRKYINILIVFGVSGLWHGASWNFVAWGLIHAFYQIIGDVKKRVDNKYGGEKQKSFSNRLRNIVGTFILVDFAWIFFLSSSFRHAIGVIKQMISCLYCSGVGAMGLETTDLAVILASVMLLFAVDIMHENNISVFDFVKEQEIWFRWIVYLGLIWTIIMLGIYGAEYDPTTFIYFQF